MADLSLSLYLIWLRLLQNVLTLLLFFMRTWWSSVEQIANSKIENSYYSYNTRLLKTLWHSICSYTYDHNTPWTSSRTYTLIATRHVPFEPEYMSTASISNMTEEPKVLFYQTISPSTGHVCIMLMCQLTNEYRYERPFTVCIRSCW